MEDNELDFECDAFEVHFEIDQDGINVYGDPFFTTQPFKIDNDFECDTLEVHFEMSRCLFAGGRAVPLWALSPYNRMIVALFVEGPPLGCVPGLN
jgi:hypothetical protein